MGAARRPQARESAAAENVVLHPELVQGPVRASTRARRTASSRRAAAGGIGFALCENVEQAEIGERDDRSTRSVYHTIKEVRNGAGAPPLKTAKGWLHVAQGVRNTAAGPALVLYAFLCDLEDPSRVIARAGGLLARPRGRRAGGRRLERGSFCNGAVAKATGEVLRLLRVVRDAHARGDARSVERLLDYVLHTPEDPLRSRGVRRRSAWRSSTAT